MRTLAALAAFALAAAPLSAQVSVRGLANVGYDAGYGAASAGVGAEVGWAPAGAPVAIALRPSADLVFVGSHEYADPLLGGSPRSRYTANVTRASLEAVARWAAAPGPAIPYLKAGVTAEYEQVLIGDVDSGRWQEDAVAGGGALLGRFYAEATLGFGDASRSRVALGVRF